MTKQNGQLETPLPLSAVGMHDKAFNYIRCQTLCRVLLSPVDFVLWDKQQEVAQPVLSRGHRLLPGWLHTALWCIWLLASLLPLLLPPPLVLQLLQPQKDGVQRRLGGGSLKDEASSTPISAPTVCNMARTHLLLQLLLLPLLDHGQRPLQVPALGEAGQHRSQPVRLQGAQVGVAAEGLLRTEQLAATAGAAARAEPEQGGQATTSATPVLSAVSCQQAEPQH